MLVIVGFSGHLTAQDYSDSLLYAPPGNDTAAEVPLEPLDRTAQNDAAGLLGELALYFKKISETFEELDRVRELRQLRSFRTRLTGSEGALRSTVDSVRSSLSSIQREKLINTRDFQNSSSQIQSIEGYIRRLPEDGATAAVAAAPGTEAGSDFSHPSRDQAMADLEKEKNNQKKIQETVAKIDAAITDHLDFLTNRERI